MSRLVAFDVAHRRLALLLVVLFVLLVGLRLHGYSTPIWHERTGALEEASQAPELLWGRPRPLRVDDWRVLIPLALAQRAHEPAFPLVNEHVGLATPTLAPLVLPVAHPVTLLRPQLWGFFLGDDLGIAWLWWSQVLGTFYAGFLLCLLVGRGRFVLACLGGLVLVFTPFFQFWAFNPAPLLVWGVVGVVAALHGVFTRRRRALRLHAALLGYAAAAFLLALYPPYQIVLFAWLLLLFGALVLEGLREGPGLPAEPPAAERFGTLAAALLLPALFFALYWLSAGEVVERMRESAYPGGRVALGGGRSAWQVLIHDLLAAGRIEDWRPMQNVLNASSFWLLFPVSAGLLLHPRAFALRRDPLLWAMLGFALLLFLYATGALPAWVGEKIFLGLLPTPRAALGLGLADLVLLVRLLGRPRQVAALPPATAGLGALAWVGLLGGVAWAARPSFPELTPGWVAGALGLNAALAFLLLRGRRPRVALALMLAGLVLSTAWYHPMVRGGSAALRENPVSRAMREIDAAEERPTTWAVLGDRDLGSLPRVLGLRSVNGVLPVPQLELWGRLDPDGEQRFAYNRFANVQLAASSAPQAQFVLPDNLDRFLVRLPLRPEVLHRLGVTHFVWREPRPEAWRGYLERFPRLQKLRSLGELHFYRVAPPGEAGRAEPAT